MEASLAGTCSATRADRPETRHFRSSQAWNTVRIARLRIPIPPKRCGNNSRWIQYSTRSIPSATKGMISSTRIMCSRGPRRSELLIISPNPPTELMASASMI